MATASSRVSVGCPEGRNSDEWIDFDFFGQQIVAHKVKEMKPDAGGDPADGHDVPVSAFRHHPRHEGLAATDRPPDRRRHEIRYRTLCPLQGRAGQAGDDVLPRPLAMRRLIFGLTQGGKIAIQRPEPAQPALPSFS